MIRAFEPGEKSKKDLTSPASPNYPQKLSHGGKGRGAIVLWTRSPIGREE